MYQPVWWSAIFKILYAWNCNLICRVLSISVIYINSLGSSRASAVCITKYSGEPVECACNTMQYAFSRCFAHAGCLLYHCNAVHSGKYMKPVTRAANKGDLYALRLKVQWTLGAVS